MLFNSRFGWPRIATKHRKIWRQQWRENCSTEIISRSRKKCVGRMSAINWTTIKVALKNNIDPASFQYSRIWQVPLLVFELSSTRVELFNMSFSIHDGEVACDDLPVDFSVLRHLGINSRILLGRNRSTLDATEFASVNNIFSSNSCGWLDLLMVACVRRVVASTKNNSNGEMEKRSILNPRCSRGIYFEHKHYRRILQPSHTRNGWHTRRKSSKRRKSFDANKCKR